MATNTRDDPRPIGFSVRAFITALGVRDPSPRFYLTSHSNPVSAQQAVRELDQLGPEYTVDAQLGVPVTQAQIDAHQLPPNAAKRTH